MRSYILGFLSAAVIAAVLYFFLLPPQPAEELAKPPAPPPPQAYSKGASMRGLSPIMVLVEKLPDAATPCGLNHDALRTTAELALSQSDVQVVKTADAAKGYLYVQVNVLMAENICAANIYVAFRTTGVIESNQQITVASIWNENVIGAAWPNGAAREISLAVENLTKKFIEDWTRDNRSGSAERKT